MRTTIVGLADLADALRALAPEGSGWIAIARVLGLEVSPDEPAPLRPDEPVEIGAPTILEETPADREEDSGPAEAPEPEREPARADSGSPLTVEVLAQPSRSVAPPNAVQDAEPLHWSGSLLPPSSRPAPLIPPSSMRAFLREAVAPDLASDELDLDALVERVARGELPDPLPRLRRRGFRNGVFVLVDDGPPMGPFRADVADLVRGLRRIAGPQYLGERYFRGSPARGVDDGFDQPSESFRPPRPGTTVLLVTDLGVGRPRGHVRTPASKWTAVLRGLLARGCRVVVLTPYGPRRGPMPRCDGFRAISWTARRSVGGRRVEPVELARVLAAAAQIDRAILRAARVHAFPRAEVGLEADFLFSPLVTAWNERIITLRDDLLRKVRDELAADPDERDRAIRFLADYRRMAGTTDAVQYEEDLIASALAGSEAEYTRRAASLARSLLDERDEPGLARWAWSVVHELPGAMQNLEITEQLRVAAAVRLGVGRAASGAIDAAHAWLLPAETTVGLALVGDRLLLREPPEPGDSTIQVPATTPRFVFVEGQAGSPRARLQLHPDSEPCEVETPVPVELLTLSGARYRIDQDRPAEEIERPVPAVAEAEPDPLPPLASSGARSDWVVAAKSIGPEPEPTKELERIVPTVFIALGGSGREVAIRLHKRLIHGPNPDVARFAHFVFIDTDATPPSSRDDACGVTGDPRTGGVEWVTCRVGPEQRGEIAHRLEAGVESSHLRWLVPSHYRMADTKAEWQTGGHRQLGRLQFFVNYPAIRRALQTQLDQVFWESSGLPDAQSGQAEVVIVASLAGGTGSGMLLDTAYLARELLAEGRGSSVKSRISLMCLLPGVFEFDQTSINYQRQNAYAALLELEHYGSARTGDEVLLGTLDTEPEPGPRFPANWDGRPRLIEGPGWDACYLIDNVNSAGPDRPLPPDELFQMTADFLALDFDAGETGKARRTARSNLVQFRERRLISFVRGSDDETDVRFAVESSCGYSSFGLAGLLLDVHPLIRAAGDRLAIRLVRERWLGRADRMSPDEYRRVADRDLIERRDGSGSSPQPSFTADDLAHQLFDGHSSNLIDELAAELASLERRDFRSASEALAEFSKALDVCTRALKRQGEHWPGPAQRLMEENSARLLGGVTRLGPLRSRLADLVADRLATLGAASTQRLIQIYDDVLRRVRDRALSIAATPEANLEPLRELHELLKSPWIIQRLRSGRIAKARSAVVRFIRYEYRRAAATTVARIYDELLRFLGVRETAVPPDLARHGTLRARCDRMIAFLDRLIDRLGFHFESVRREHDSGGVIETTVGSFPDVEHFDQLIDEALLDDPRVGDWTGTSARPVPHWANLERELLSRLDGLHREKGTVRSAAALLDAWIGDGGVDLNRLNLAGEQLGAACASFLASGPGLRFDRERGRSVVEFLERCPPDEVRFHIARVVRVSEPYFPISSSPLSPLEPVRRVLLSIPGGDGGDAVRDGDRASWLVRQVVSARGDHSFDQIWLTGGVDPGALWLVSEATGLPLQLYGRIGVLHDAYRSTPTLSGSLAECHIAGAEFLPEAPELRPIGVSSYALIRDHIGRVLLGMILGFIRWRDGTLQIRVEDRYGAGFVVTALGRRLHLAIRRACEDRNIVQYLRMGWQHWTAVAGPRDWAGVFAAASASCVELRRRSSEAWGFDRPPLLNGFLAILREATAALSSSTEGRRWLSTIEGGPSPANPTGEVDVLALEFGRDILERVAPEWPIFRVVTERLSQAQPAPDA